MEVAFLYSPLFPGDPFKLLHVSITLPFPFLPVFYIKGGERQCTGAVAASMELQVGGDASGLHHVIQDTVGLGADRLVQLAMLHGAEVKAAVEQPGH